MNNKARVCFRSLAFAGLSGLVAWSALSTDALSRELSFSVSHAPKGPVHEAQIWWAEEVKKRTNGEVTVKFYYLQSLAKLSDALKAVQSGLADIATTVPAYNQKQMPAWYLASTATGSGDQYVVTEAWRRIRENNPEIKAEEKKNKVKYLFHYSSGPAVLISKDKPYMKIGDFTGQKIRLTSHFVRAAKAYEWNVTPVRVKFPEIYSALEKGVLDGAVSYLNSVPVYKHNEVAKYLVEMNLGQTTLPVFMNMKAWNELTDAQKKVFEDLRIEMIHKYARLDLEEGAQNRANLSAEGKYKMELLNVSADDRRAWAEALTRSTDINIEKSSKVLPNAGELTATYMAEIGSVEADVAKNGYPWK